LNGVVASLAVTEFMAEVTGLRPAKHMLTYRAHHGGVSVATDAPSPGCYYCTHVRGRGADAGVERYLRQVQETLLAGTLEQGGEGGPDAG